MKIDFSADAKNESVIVVPVKSGNVIGDIDANLKTFIEKSLEGEKDFTGAEGQTVTLRGSNIAQKVILVGVGQDTKMTPNSFDSIYADRQRFHRVAAALYGKLTSEGTQKVTVAADKDVATLSAWLAQGLLLQSYTFDKFKSAPTKGIESITFRTLMSDFAKELFEAVRTETDSVFWTSDLENEPANLLYPEAYAERVQKELAPLGIKVTILHKEDMEKLGMNAALAVGQGSSRPPCMVVLEYDGTNGEQNRPLALVGKGITFDSGGISLKPGSGMDAMSLDMSGSATVAGAIRALAMRKTPTRVVGVMALAENLPDGNAQRPGDIVKSMNGKTIMVGNTDAEGRLVLADAMTYVQRTYDPHTLIDLATLTGAAVAALGGDFAAVFSNNDRLFQQFNTASGATGEKIWRMPLMETDAFTKMVRDTPLADLSNSVGGPGALTAAAFLHEFIEKDEKGKDKCNWIHIDMAGPGMPKSVRKGWGVALLNHYVRRFMTTAQQPANDAQAKAIARKSRHYGYAPK